MKKYNTKKLQPIMQTKLFTFVFKRAAQSLTSIAMLFVMLLINQSEIKAQAYTSGDTSVCRSQTVTYTFSGAGLTFTVLGGGTITATSANTVTVAWGSVAGVYMIRVVGASTIFQNVIVEGDVALACDALVNVSLDGNCRAVITPETMLEGAPFPGSSYSVTVYDENNNILPANTVTYSYLGKTLRVLVRHLCSGVTCWGRIYIEDKYIPSLLCDNRADTINCGQGYTPEALSTLVGFSGLAFPLPSSSVITPHADGQVGHYTVTGFDLCCAVDLRYYDVYNKYNCTTPYYASVYRFWYAEDCKGNKTNCSDTIYIRRGTLNAVVCPDNYDGFTHPALKCKDKEPATGPYPRGWNALDNGNPSPYNYYNATGSLIWYGTGAPANTGCDHLAVSFRDVKIPVCGESFKVLRNWKIFDWCTGSYSECNQLIKVADAEAPVITCPQNGQVFGTDYYSCTGTITLPFPTVIEECSSTTVTVGYIINEPDGTRDVNNIRTAGVSYPTSSSVRITGLPADSAWIQFYVTDACGNTSTCRTEVIIEDNLDPVAVCDEHTVVTLNEQGVAWLYASSVNNGSYDNCGIDSMRVRRMEGDSCNVATNTIFSPSVTFCCSDVGTVKMVAFRVYDKEGNFNDCMVSVTVQDKISPKITCPSNKTVNCGTDLNDLSITGQATATGTCNNIKVTYTTDTLSWKCDTGTVRRNWRAENAGGRFDLCTQTIRVINPTPFTCGSVGYPPNITINGCSPVDADPNVTGKPTYPTRACTNVIAGYSDDKIYGEPGYCVRIIRHWKVIDWCQYDVNSSNPVGICTMDQVIRIRNTVAPVMNAATCSAKEICANDASCNGYVELVGLASDDCTDTSALAWKYSIDLDNNGSNDINGTTKIASGTYKKGTHKIRWEVTDACGNVTTCNQIFAIRDCKDPTIVCKTGLVITVMPSTGRITVKARDFIESSTQDNCTSFANLRYSFSTNVNDSTRTYTCDSLTNGREGKFTVTVYVWDEFNNKAFCTTMLTIQDNIGNVCPDRFGNGGMISGIVRANTNSPLRNANLMVVSNNIEVNSMNSIEDGQYSFVDLKEGVDYNIMPSKDDDYINGVTTADIVLIQKHILGIQSFDSPYKYIAADANNSNSISAADLSELRRLILGVTTRFGGGQKSWRFVASGFQFEDQDNPWAGQAWPEMVTINNLSGENKDNNFVAVKIGDLNASARTNQAGNGGQSRTAAKLNLQIKETELKAGETVMIPVYGTWASTLSGFQMSWKFNPEAVQSVNVKSGTIQCDERNLGFGKWEEGLVAMSWNSNQSILSTDQPLFYFVITANQAVAQFIPVLSSEILTAEAYDDEVNVMSVELRNKTNQAAVGEFELMQNEPNPFFAQTKIRFVVPEKQLVSISIHSLDGKTIFVKMMEAKAGYNELIIQSQDIAGSGLMYYSMESSNFKATKRMFLVK